MSAKSHEVMRIVLGLVLALAVFGAIWTPARALSGFYRRLDALNDDIRRGDVGAAKAALPGVTAFYAARDVWGVGWMVDRYVFHDAFLHRAAAAYLAGDYESVAADLKDKIDDARAAHLLGCARFRLAQRRYRAANGGTSETAKAAIVQEVTDSIASDFERAIRLDQDDRFADKWNYDLTSDADAARRALAQPDRTRSLDVEQTRITSVAVRRRRG